MNISYRRAWSHAARARVVVPETAHGRGKRARHGGDTLLVDDGTGV